MAALSSTKKERGEKKRVLDIKNTTGQDHHRRKILIPRSQLNSQPRTPAENNICISTKQLAHIINKEGRGKKNFS